MVRVCEKSPIGGMHHIFGSLHLFLDKPAGSFLECHSSTRIHICACAVDESKDYTLLLKSN